MKTVLRLVLISIGIWAVPFLISIPMHSNNGDLLVNYWLFKIIMVSTLTGTAVGLFRWFYFNSSSSELYVYWFILVGLVSLTIQLLLDSITVIPMGAMTWQLYIQEIGIIYLVLIPISIIVGKQVTKGVRHEQED